MITLGTGIGFAIFNDGALVPNAELGHIEMHGKDAEEFASARIRDEVGADDVGSASLPDAVATAGTGKASWTGDVEGEPLTLTVERVRG